jgi:hypothetical protein
VIRACPVANKQKAVDICNAFVEGAPRDAVGDVFYGVDKSNVKLWRKSKLWFYLDNSAFDAVRGQQYRIAKNRVQVDPANQTSDGHRFANLGIEIKPMHAEPGEFWLAVEQSPSFMQYVANDLGWLERRIALLMPNDTVHIRSWGRDKLMQQKGLPSALDGAYTVLTHSSAAAVTAALLGVPCKVSPMSALYTMRWSTDPDHDQRLRYMQVLADNQWTLDEIREGRAWRWLNR